MPEYDNFRILLKIGKSSRISIRPLSFFSHSSYFNAPLVSPCVNFSIPQISNYKTKHINIMRRSFDCCPFCVTGFSAAIAQQRPGNPNPTGSNSRSHARRPRRSRRSAAAPSSPQNLTMRSLPTKPSATPGLFTVHKVEDKWYFEIPDSIFGRDILVSTRYDKTSAGGNYGGEQVNVQTIRWEKGPIEHGFPGCADHCQRRHRLQLNRSHRRCGIPI